MSIYEDWGFTSSPFLTTSLPASDLGERLLVGREKELGQLTRRIESSNAMATVEGLNGVGKTSVVNVGAHQLFKRHITKGQGKLFIPCRSIFQLSPKSDPADFTQSVLMEVAQTLIDSSASLKASSNWVETADVGRWLNTPQTVSFQGGVWVIQGGAQTELNSTVGFEKSGFRKAVTAWLERIFPDAENGGVICTIDNLELLQSSDAARNLLEQLRDELFNIKGLRWVLCGALGIVYGVASSPRLDGMLQEPIPVAEIDSKHIRDVIRSRLQAYSTLHGARLTFRLRKTTSNLSTIFLKETFEAR